MARCGHGVTTEMVSWATAVTAKGWCRRFLPILVPPCKSVHGFTEDGTLPGIVEDSIVGSGSIVSGGKVERSILGRGVRVNSYCNVADSIVMDDVTIGRYAQLKRCIIDKNVIIPEGMKIGFDLDRDRQLFKVSQEGIVVVPKGMDLSPEG